MKAIKSIILLLTSFAALALGFSVESQQRAFTGRKAASLTDCTRRQSSTSSSTLFAKLSDKRRKELGVGDDEDEYDLSKALEANTDPLITKIIAGSLILVILALLVVGVIIPSTTDYGDGLCNPLLTGGRC
jgi:hypothetical protein